LLDRFIERQRIVSDLLHEIRPDFFGKGPRPSKEHIVATHRGSWGPRGEWLYYIHGSGCRIVHADSKEPIEWCGDDTSRFDPAWFARWVEWAIDRGEGDEHALNLLRAHLKDRAGESDSVIASALSALERQGKLRHYPLSTNSYGRVTDDDPHAPPTSGKSHPH
jgi:hypothetical protein